VGRASRLARAHTGSRVRFLKGTPSRIVRALESPDAEGRLRCVVDGEIMQSQADDDGLALLDLAETWRTQFKEKGWTTR
jgi:hypothetical protein